MSESGGLRRCRLLLPSAALLLLLAVFPLSLAQSEQLGEKSKDPRFIVMRVTPQDEEQLKLLNLLVKEAHHNDLDFWKSPTALGHFADIMMPAEKLAEISSLFDSLAIPHITTIDDVKQLIIDRESPKPRPLDDGLLGSFAKRFHDGFATRNRAKYGFGEYHGYGEIVRWLNEIAQQYPSMARVMSIGTTAEGRNIVTIKIGTNVARNDKRVVWIDGGIHAREWGAIHTALYFIEQLIAGYETDGQIRLFVDDLTFYITPVLNPDGFEYTRSDVSPTKRLWRKNRSGISCTKDRWFRERCCGGVDLNRNFDFHWAETGSSDDRCSEIYQGTSAFSEAESRAVRDMLISPDLWGKVDAFITLHTYSQMWIHPYSHAVRAYPADVNELATIGQRAVTALEALYGTKYRFGTGADILYPSAGGSDDWAKAKGSAKYVYLIELRPGEDVWDGFVLDPRQLIPMGRETWEGIKVVVQAVVDRQQQTVQAQQIQQAQLAARNDFSSTVAPSFFLSKHVRTRPRRPSRVRLVHQRPGTHSAVSGVLVRRPAVSSSVAPAASSSTCRDVSPWCRAWLNGNPNVCTVSSIYMSRDCAATCRFCS